MQKNNPRNKKQSKKRFDEREEIPIEIPTLPPLPETFDPQIYSGPTDYSNWLIPNYILIGAYPRTKNLRPIIDVGIKKFICLMEDFELKKQGDYFNYALKERVEDFQSYSFIRVPIKDHGILKDEELLNLVNQIIDWFYKGEKMYIHCYGGHGRSGSIVTALLIKLYSLDSFTALEVCQKLHDCRKKPRNMKSPESAEQRNQIHRLMNKLLSS